MGEIIPFEFLSSKDSAFFKAEKNVRWFTWQAAIAKLEHSKMCRKTSTKSRVAMLGKVLSGPRSRSDRGTRLMTMLIILPRLGSLPKQRMHHYSVLTSTTK